MEMHQVLYFVLIFVTAYSVCNDCSSNNTRVLSRRKRFLTFPEGSSLQLGICGFVSTDHGIRLKWPRISPICIHRYGDPLPEKKLFFSLETDHNKHLFCLQTAALIPIGDIFLYGNTAALAWNLPTDPNFLTMLKDHDKAQRRNDVTKSIYYVDNKGKLVAKVPYSRHSIINPAFAKRSTDGKTTFKEKLKIKIDRMKMHRAQIKSDYLRKENLNEKTIEFHRSSRVGLFEKLEVLLTGLGADGRQCVLYKLCESAQILPRQGTFQQELLRVVFTLPKGKTFESDAHQEYDKAHNTNNDCASLYPGCEGFDPIQL